MKLEPIHDIKNQIFYHSNSKIYLIVNFIIREKLADIRNQVWSHSQIWIQFRNAAREKLQEIV
jgi:hypothetical protein